MLSYPLKAFMQHYKFLTILMMWLLPLYVKAQRPDNQKMEAFKISFLTQKLNLSVEEAKIFWPIFNEYQREQNALRKDRRQKVISFRKVTEIDNLSDVEIQTLIASDFNFKQRDLNIDKKYYGKLKSSGLSIKTIGKFYRAQEAFKKELLNRFRNGGADKR